MLRAMVVAAVLALGVGAHAQEPVYAKTQLGELLAHLPTFFNQIVSVEGDLVGWGDVAALDSDVTREIMVDLRPLGPDLQRQINETCTQASHCRAMVDGKVVQIRGEGISELGIEAVTIKFDAM
jgi:hypothetical protein